MVVSFDAAKFLSVVRALSGICTRRNYDSTSSLVTISVAKNKTTISATSEYSEIRFTIDSQASSSAEFTLYYDDLSKSVAGAKSLSIDIRKSSIVITNGSSKFTLRPVAKKVNPTFKEIAPHHLVDGDAFVELFRRAEVVPSLKLPASNIGTDSIRFNLVDDNVFAWSCSNPIAFCGFIDSHPQGPANKENSFLVKAALLAPLVRYLSDNDDEIAIWSDKNSAYFWSDQIQFRVAQSAGVFPRKLGAIMDHDVNFKTSFYGNRDECQSMVRDTQRFTSGDAGVSFKVSAKQIVASIKTEVGDVVSKAAITSKGADCQFKLRSKYLDKVLAVLPGDPLVKYVDDSSPIYVSSINYKYAIMVYGETDADAAKSD